MKLGWSNEKATGKPIAFYCVYEYSELILQYCLPFMPWTSHHAMAA